MPLLELQGEVIIESEAIVRRIAECLFPSPSGLELLPAAQKEVIDQFVQLWVHTVEGRYYDVLTARDEQAARYYLAHFVEALVHVENHLWLPRYEWG